MGYIRRTSSDDLKTSYREEIHGEKFCRHASNAADQMKENRGEATKGMKECGQKASSLECLLRKRVKIDGFR
jgi:hypothetical protein